MWKCPKYGCKDFYLLLTCNKKQNRKRKKRMKKGRFVLCFLEHRRDNGEQDYSAVKKKINNRTENQSESVKEYRSYKSINDSYISNH